MLNLNSDKKLPPISVLQKTGWNLELTASGKSMEPVINNGDTVEIICKPPEDLQVGDVICFEKNGSFVLHRIIETESSGRQFKSRREQCGDNFHLKIWGTAIVNDGHYPILWRITRMLRHLNSCLVEAIDGAASSLQ